MASRESQDPWAQLALQEHQVCHVFRGRQGAELSSVVWKCGRSLEFAQSELQPQVGVNRAEFEAVGSDCWAIPAGKCHPNAVESTAER